MNAFVRKLAVLSVLWSLCELLLPDGRQQKMVRMTVSVLVMMVLVSSLSGLLMGVGESQTPVVESAAMLGEQSYARIALQALANQAERLCVRMAQNAGYVARAAVYLREDGALERVELRLGDSREEGAVPLISQRELVERMAAQLGVKPSFVQLLTDGAMHE